MKFHVPFLRFIPIDFQFSHCQHCGIKNLKVSRLRYSSEKSYVEFRHLPVCADCLHNDKLYRVVEPQEFDETFVMCINSAVTIAKAYSLLRGELFQLPKKSKSYYDLSQFLDDLHDAIEEYRAGYAHSVSLHYNTPLKKYFFTVNSNEVADA